MAGAAETGHRTSPRQMWRERRSIRQHFTWGGFATALVLGLTFSALDMGSDIAFAEQNHTITSPEWMSQLPREHISSLTYVFMSMPGLVLAYSWLQTNIASFLVRVTGCKDSSCSPVCNGVINLVSLALLVVELFLVGMMLIKSDIKYLAIPTAAVILLIKVIALFVHTDRMKRLSIKATMAESSFESSLQLLLVLLISLLTNNFTTNSIFSGITSIMMLGKSGAESYLTFSSTNKLEGANLLVKLKHLAKLAPMFSAVAAFRIGSMSVTMVSSAYMSLVLLLPPLLLLLAAKCCCLTDLTVGDLIRGFLAEVSGPALWGGRSSEGCRSIQLAFATYYHLLYTVLLTFIISDSFHGSQYYLMEARPNYQTFATACLVMGWVSYPLLLLQLYARPTVSRLSNLANDL